MKRFCFAEGTMIEDITPVILTYNEAPNIARTLEKLYWALEVVVVDSFSDDDTIRILKNSPSVRVFQRKFDSHANQWNFCLKDTGISTDWVLALDADYVLSDQLIEELKGLRPGDDIQGYRAGFRYCIQGKPLRGTVYPPVTVLYRRERASYKQDGHTQRVRIDGRIADLTSFIYHDDRKPLSHWLQSQSRYMKLEAQKLLSSAFSEMCWTDRLRRFYILAPFMMFCYCLIVKGAMLDGKAGFYYAFQRMVAEMILSLRLLESDIKDRAMDEA